MKGWIKLHRQEQAWLQDLTDPEFRYYLSSRLVADWDIKHKAFGTFDARTQEVQRMTLPGWSKSKTNDVKNALLRKGVYQLTEDRYRLKITNADLWYRGGRVFEDVIRSSVDNLHSVGYDFRARGIEITHILRTAREIARSKSVN